jgi:hypothetical protein
VALLISAGCRRPTPQESAYRPTSTIREIMVSVVAPSAEGLWTSVGTVSNEKGTVNLEPKTAEEWDAVRRHAVALIEATNLLLIPGRHIAPPGAPMLQAEEAVPGSTLRPDQIERQVLAGWSKWTDLAHALHDAAMPVLGAIDKKDAAALLTTGSELDMACENCHMTFWYPPRAAKAKQ